MKKTATILLMSSMLFSCGKTEEKFLFKKGSQDYNAANAAKAEECKKDNARLIDNLTKSSAFKNLFASGVRRESF